MKSHIFDIEDAINYGVDCAVMLTNFRFWIAKNKANNVNFYDGQYWTYNSVKAFEDLFPYYSGGQIKRTLKKLEDLGLIKSGNYNKSKYDRTKWYSINEDSHLPKSTNGKFENNQPIPDVNSNVNSDFNNCLPEIINFVDDDHFNEYFKLESSLINNDLKKKKKLREKKESLETFKRIDIGNANNDLVQLYIKYLFVRCDKGNAILNPDAMQANFNKLNKLNENQKMECLLMSVENNWIGLFPDKIEEKKPQKIGSMNVSNMPKYDFDNIPDPLKDFR
jgi:hypothetical protein